MRRLVLIVLLLLSLIPVTLLGLAASESGTRLIFKLAHAVYPALSIETVEGNLLGTLTLRALSFQQPKGAEITASRLVLSWRPKALFQPMLAIDRLELDDVRIVTEAGENQAPPPSLPQITLPIHVVVKEATVHHLEIVRPDAPPTLLGQVSLGADMSADRLLLHHLDLTMAELALQATGDLRLTQTYPLTLSLNWRYQGTTPWNGTATLTGDLESLAVSHRLQGPFRVTTQGRLSHLLNEPTLDIEGKWQEITWPLEGETQWRARDGHFHLQGRLENYHLEAGAHLSGSSLPSTRITLSAEGNLENLALKPLHAEGPVGILEAKGSIRWAPRFSWDLSLKGKDLDPGKWHADWPGSLIVDAHSTGRLQPDLNLSLAIEQLRGRLRGQPLEASGVLSYRRNELKAEGFHLDWAGNHLQLQGKTDPQHLDLGFRLRAPHLDRLDPYLRGKVAGSGRFTGSRRQPHLDLALEGEGFAWKQDLTIQRLSLRAQGNPDDPASRLQLDLTRLRLGAWQFDRAELKGRGRLASHRYRLNAQGPLGGLRVQGDGRVLPHGDSFWQGSIDRLPLSLLRPLLPPEVNASGDLRGQYSYHLRGEKREGRLDWQLPEVILTVATSDEQTIRLSLLEGKGTASIQDQTLRSRFVLPFPGHGRLEGELATNLASQTLDGRGRIDFTQLALFQILVPQLEEVKGEIHGTTRLTGSWTRPRIEGQLALTHAEAVIPAAGVHLKEIELHATSRADGIVALRGQVRSGPGLAHLQGQFSWTKQPSLALTLKGERFEAANLPQAKVLISPDLIVNATPSQVRIEGLVHLPETRITLERTLLPDQEPDMVSVSADEVIIGRPTRTRSHPFKIDARIRLTLGDQVFFTGYGIDARLQGALDLITRNNTTRAEGEIRLMDGQFAAYGQKLVIDSGRFIFSGPLDNPALDLLITRTFRREQITANLAIRGFAQDPQIQVSSDPPLAEEEALAYLITGRSLKNLSSTSNGGAGKQALTQAMGSLGVGYLKKLGLEDIAQVEFEEGFFVVGKYLTPELYVGYAVDVFSGLGEAVVRYQLTRHLMLEGRSGQTQSGDLLYTIETH